MPGKWRKEDFDPNKVRRAKELFDKQFESAGKGEPIGRRSNRGKQIDHQAEIDRIDRDVERMSPEQLEDLL